MFTQPVMTNFRRSLHLAALFLCGLVGAIVSASFLLLIAFANILVLISLIRVFRRVKDRGRYEEEDLDLLLAGRGLLSRIFRPFFGIIGVAPPPAWGRCGSAVPRAFGGNMDNKELKPGTTLFLPVFNDGALFMAGDGHGVQGDGEVCITALETGLSGTFRLTVRKDLGFSWPFAETPTDLMTIGLHENLDEAMRQAVREMVRHVCARSGLTRNQAYMLCSLAGDLRVTQTVDGNKGVHMMMAKGRL